MIKIKKFPFAPKGDPRLEDWGYLDEAIKMNKYIKNGDVIFDCGANIFDHSVFFAINNPNSKVVAFEPIKEYFEMGLENTKHFNVGNIIPMNVALGEKRSEMVISVSNEGSSLVFDHKTEQSETISVETIDQLVENKKIPAPNIIKIDVEGFALPLILGAKNTLVKYKPLIFIEVHPQFVGYENAKQKIRELSKVGFNVIKRLDQKRQFIVIFGDEKFDWERAITLLEVEEIRGSFDQTSDVKKRDQLLDRYNKISKEIKIPFFKRIFWSKMYVFFKFKIKK